MIQAEMPTIPVSSSNPAPPLNLQNVRKIFGGKVAVENLSLTVRAGEFYALLGSNGAGKTTTLRMIAGLLAPDLGDIRLYGRSLKTEPQEARRPLAYLPDDPLLYGKLRPAEYLEFVAGLWGIPAAEAATEAERLLKWLDLWETCSQLTEGFSRGMKQKLALAGALIHQPRLLLLDEPLTGLDAAAARLVKDALRQFAAAGGAVILTTHIMEVAADLASRIGVIHQGRLVAEGSLAELRQQTGSGERVSLGDVFLQLVGAAPSLS